MQRTRGASRQHPPGSAPSPFIGLGWLYVYTGGRTRGKGFAHMITDKEARDVINAARLGPCDLFTSAFLGRLLDQHPRATLKRAPGVVGFAVRRNTRGTGRATLIVRPDGTEEAFSWLKCCGKARPRQALDQAYRASVDDQVRAFRGANNVPHDHHVDHVEPWTFARIVDAFEDQHGAVEVSRLIDVEQGAILPEPERSRFAEFHRNVAVLRSLPAADNLRAAARQRDRTVQSKLRRMVFQRDFGVCALCGWSCAEDREELVQTIPLSSPIPPTFWHADHIRPLTKGGTNDLANLRTLCVPCHVKETRKLYCDHDYLEPDGSCSTCGAVEAWWFGESVAK